jgi:hypothetical protein
MDREQQTLRAIGYDDEQEMDEYPDLIAQSPLLSG